MNKYRSHNCSELEKKKLIKKLIYLGGCIEKEIMEIYYL